MRMVGRICLLIVLSIFQSSYAQSQPRAIELNIRSNGYTDHTYVQFIDTAHFGFDISDATKRMNEIFNLYSLSSDQHPLAINGINGFECSFEIPLRLEDTWEGEYEFSWNVMDPALMETYSIQILDYFTGEVYDLSSESGFLFEIFDDPESAAPDRFRWLFETLSYRGEWEVEVDQDCGSLMGRIEVENTLENFHYSLVYQNQSLATMAGNGQTIHFENITPGLKNLHIEISPAWCSQLTSSRAVEAPFITSPVIEYDPVHHQLKEINQQKGLWYADQTLLNTTPSSSIPAHEGSAHILKVSNDFCQLTSEAFVVTGLSEEAGIQVGPNPTTDWLQLSSAQLSVEKIRITSIRGVSKDLSVSEDGRIDLRSLARGIYLLEIPMGPGHFYTRKILKQ